MNDWQYRFDSGRVGMAQRTEDGFLRCYMRLAVADRPYTYMSGTSVRREVIPAAELFRGDSADTFKMLPITLQHPAQRLVTPANARELGRGSTGHTVIRERTANGDFLGITATVFDKEAIDAIEAGWQVSPGYRVRTRTRSDGMFDQFDRRGNHTAIVQKARGGDDVAAVLEGLNMDGEGDEYWAQSPDELLWRVDFDEGLIIPLLANPQETIAERTPIVLDARKAKRPDPNDDEELDEEMEEGDDDEEMEETEGKKAHTFRKRGKRASPKGFGSAPKSKKGKCDACKHTKTDAMATVNIDGIGYEVDQDLALLIQPHLERSDAYDELIDNVSALQERIDSLEEDLEEALSSAEDLIAAIEAEEEEEDYYYEQTDSADSFETSVALVQMIDQMREDGKLLVDRGMVESFNYDAAYILENLEDLQREMLALANPGLRTDDWAEEQIDIAYDVAFSTLRSQPGQSRNDGMVLSLSAMPDVAKPGRPKDIRSVLRALSKADDEAFDNSGATMQVSPLAASGLGQIHMM